MKIKNKTKKIRRNKKIFAIVLFLLIGSSAIFYNNQTHNKKNPDSISSNTDKSSSANITDKPAVTVDDTSGKDISNTAESKWTRSKDDNIIVYSPINNESVSGTVQISGTSKLDIVSYRLLDNINGMITTGNLKVTGGKFSGRVVYNTRATEGRMDIFTSDDMGNENNNIEIDLKFN